MYSLWNINFHVAFHIFIALPTIMNRNSCRSFSRLKVIAERFFSLFIKGVIKKRSKELSTKIRQKISRVIALWAAMEMRPILLSQYLTKRKYFGGTIIFFRRLYIYLTINLSRWSGTERLCYLEEMRTD